MAFSWSTIKKPIFILAPMEDVTDVAFREMFAKYGKPDVMVTEFVSTEGLMHPEGRKKLKIDLAYTEIQRPIIAQIWGTDPDKFYRVSEYLVELGFDGIDINMGCPQSKEIQVGSCAALIRTPELAKEIIRATKKGAGSLPVSVKTRIGYSKSDEMESWLMHLLEMELAAITLHGRTKQEMSKVPAHWDKIKEAVEIRNREKSQTIIIGNGDIGSLKQGLDRVAETDVDGVMIARGTFGNPWFFDDRYVFEYEGTNYRTLGADEHNKILLTVAEKLRVMIEHAKLFEKMFSETNKSFMIMRKHFKAYASGFPGAAELRAKLMETKNADETEEIVRGYLEKIK